MKFIFLFFILVFELFSSVLKTPIVSIDKEIVTINTKHADVGMTGFIVHHINKNHSSILKSVVVTEFNDGVATLKTSAYTALRQNSLPLGKWEVEVGDTVVLAFGYSRGLLIAPSENIYRRLERGLITLQWVHPDIFATLLSYNGHPTPLKEDFDAFSTLSAVGLIFFYIDNNLFTLDAKTFKILNITSAPLELKETHLPFYTRIQEIDADWWGEGSDELESYEPYYYSLLVKYNKTNQKLYDILKVKKYNDLLDEFEIKE